MCSCNGATFKYGIVGARTAVSCFGAYFRLLVQIGRHVGHAQYPMNALSLTSVITNLEIANLQRAIGEAVLVVKL